MNKKVIITVVLLVIAIFGAIGVFVFFLGDQDQESIISKKSKDEASTTYTFPFTGLETTEEPTHRAVAVMINNHPQARPQSGLEEADIVFELLAEGNITRFLALYHSMEPERVGPVRSAREYYADLANQYDALYIYHGAADFVNELIVNRGIPFLNGSQYDNDKQLFIRETFRVAPHNSYLLFNEVYRRAEMKQYDMEYDHEPLPFLEDDDEVTGIEAPYAKIQYSSQSSTVEYEYDETREAYIRTSDGTVTTDLGTETPIEIDNVFIIEATHEVIDAEGRRAIDLQSGGFGYLLQRGKVQKVQWENVNGYLLAKKNEEVVPFVPGKTWVNVIQASPPKNVEQLYIPEYNE